VTEADIRAALRELPNGRVERPEFESLTDEQIRYLEGILSGPRSAISGPLVVMLASPELGDLAQRLMAYARFAGSEGFGSVPPKLNELAVLMAARTWSSPYVWNAHHRFAVSVGLPAELVQAIRTGSPPAGDRAPDLHAVHALLDEFLPNQ